MDSVMSFLQGDSSSRLAEDEMSIGRRFFSDSSVGLL